MYRFIIDNDIPFLHGLRWYSLMDLMEHAYASTMEVANICESRDNNMIEVINTIKPISIAQWKMYTKYILLQNGMIIGVHIAFMTTLHC